MIYHKGTKITFKRLLNRIKYLFEILFFKKMFRLWETLGFHITKNHYYEPIPNIKNLKEEIFQKYSELTSINLNENEQLKLLSTFITRYKKEYDGLLLNWNRNLRPYEYYINNGSFESVDGEILYCMIRHFKPKRIIEIGSGFSTYLILQTIQKNKMSDKEYDCYFATIDPYPNESMLAGSPEHSCLIPKNVQEISLQKFKELKNNDILFIDSSHILKIGSDVYHEYLKILPILNKGVIIHIHDIFLPAEYPKESILKEHRFFNEQYLLQAFLTFNPCFEVLWAGSYMHLKYPDRLEKAFNSYNRKKILPGSFWMRRTK